MSEKPGTGMPWAGLAIVAALVSGTLLPQGVFETLRPTERDRAQASDDAKLEIDARLWEDPFVAARRHEAERLERCRPSGSQPMPRMLSSECKDADLAGRRDVVSFRKNLHLRDSDDLSHTLVIAALVSGHPFVGAEETRRRTRYAMLAGLQAQGYVPAQPERLGMMQLVTRKQTRKNEAVPASVFAAQPDPTACSPTRVRVEAPCPPATENFSLDPDVTIPYEVLTDRSSMREGKPRGSGVLRYRQIALLWINETELSQETSNLESLGKVFDQLLDGLKSNPKLVVIGPSTSDSLRQALDDLGKAAQKAFAAAPPPARREIKSLPPACPVLPEVQHGTEDEKVNHGLRQLACAEILSTSATAPDEQIEELDRQRLENFLDAQFEKFFPATATLPFEHVDFHRMIATDNEVLKRLVEELQIRLTSRQRRRVVVIAERDSVYAQALVAELKHRLDSSPNLKPEVKYFFRGIDGVTMRDGYTTRDGEKPRDARPDRPQTTYEWPESRDQLDYLRRLAASLQESERSDKEWPIGAIGIVASDVHDKLLVLQALRDAFADKVFFTTDMDARFLHPRAVRFTRNLLVASSLPLEFRDSDVFQGAPVLRDVYQSATYLAARRAACSDDRCRKREDEASKPALDHPSLYEIGRHRAVALGGYDFRPSTGRWTMTLVATALAAMLVGASLVWPSTPSLRSAKKCLSLHRSPIDPTVGRQAAVLVALHFALIGYTVGSLIEMARPGRISVYGLLLVSVACAFAAVLMLYPQHVADGAASASSTRRRAGRPVKFFSGTDEASIAAFVVVVLVTAGAGWVATSPCGDCEPVAWLEGISAWPSHLIHLAALAVILWSLDHFWAAVRRPAHHDCEWLAVAAVAYPASRMRSATMRARVWLARTMPMAWARPHSGALHFGALWRRYLWIGRFGARAARVSVYYAVTVTLAALLFKAFSDGYVTEIPVRGVEHRRLVAWTLYAVLALLPLLVVAVADAIMLESNFIVRLGRVRTMHGDATVRHFTRALGDAANEWWSRRLFADPAERNASDPPAAAARHTLLDDWIDVQLVARRTRVVSPMVLGPFIVIALLVVARSRLFDNWAVTLPVALAAAAYLLWLVVLTLLLKTVAERMRRSVLDRMKADLAWLRGCGPWRHESAPVEMFEQLVASVENNTTGAFAPFMEQPLFKALLVPLGSVSAAQLVDRLLLANYP